MDERVSLRINTPAVSAEAFDDEIVIIDFNTGNYFSLDDAGFELWKLLEAGVDRASITSEMIRRFKGDPQKIAAAVDHLLEELLREGIIRKEKARRSVEDAVVSPLFSSEKERRCWPEEALTLHKYSDMQDLLLLDPIHEVDEKGWPHGDSGAGD